ncbi:MAG: OmpA/MotB domain protein, partial [Myxococcaceae bacterium]|nr:OmpA/MotB domain protein [Myxococcaceae bacterium]
AATPEQPGTPETDEARRTRILPRFSSLDGSIGLLHTRAAQTGAAGSFRFGLIGEYFGSSEFLRPPTLSGTAATGTDSAQHIGGTATLSYSPLDFLEIFASIRAYANANDRERPALFQVLGDTTLGVKAAGRIARGLYVGGFASVYLLNRSGDIGLLGDSTSANFGVLSTLDLRDFGSSVPLRFHFNAHYYLDNSASIVSPTEERRRAAQPGYDAARCASGAIDPTCFLEVSRIERHALGINRVDQFGINLAAEAELPWVRPFLEWSVGIPVNRQGYSCFEPGTGLSGPGGAADDDACLAREGFSSMPSRFTIGTRILPPVRGLAALLAFDIATSGSSNFVRELAPTPPWQFYFGASFAYDIHPPVQRVEVAGPERVTTREVDRTPPGGHVVGMVRDSESHNAVTGAIVTFTGHPELHILATAADGRFRSGHLVPGDYRLAITAPDFNPGECTLTIPAPAPATEGSTAPAANADPEVNVNCEVRPMPRRGGLSIHVVSSQGAAAVANANVVIAPATGLNVPSGQQAPVERTLTTDAQGRIAVDELLAGPYTVRVESSDRHMGSVGQQATVEPRESRAVEITVTRRPLRPAVAIRGNILAIMRQVHFQTNSAEILPDSRTLLEEIADTINRHPEIATVEIQGHTDNAGVPANNMTLSQSRAEAVRETLVRLGVAADKLTARGFGQTRPIRPNLTVVGRTANRRVEFHLTRAPGATAPATPRPAAARPATP